MPAVMALAGAPIRDRWIRISANVVLWLTAAIGVLTATVIVFITSLSVDIAPDMIPAGRYTLAVFETDAYAGVVARLLTARGCLYSNR